MHAVLTAKLLQQKQLLLGGSSNGSSSRVAGRQLQLVCGHCDLLLDRLQLPATPSQKKTWSTGRTCD